MDYKRIAKEVLRENQSNNLNLYTKIHKYVPFFDGELSLIHYAENGCSSGCFSWYQYLDRKAGTDYFVLLCSKDKGCRWGRKSTEGLKIYERASWWDGSTKALKPVDKDLYDKIVNDLKANNIPNHKYIGSIHNDLHIAKTGDMFYIAAVEIYYGYEYPQDNTPPTEYYVSVHLLNK